MTTESPREKKRKRSQSDTPFLDHTPSFSNLATNNLQRITQWIENVPNDNDSIGADEPCREETERRWAQESLEDLERCQKEPNRVERARRIDLRSLGEEPDQQNEVLFFLEIRTHMRWWESKHCPEVWSRSRWKYSCQHCGALIDLHHNRVAVLPSMIGDPKIADFYYVNCFEMFVDFSQAAYLDRLRTVTVERTPEVIARPHIYRLDETTEVLVRRWKVLRGFLQGKILDEIVDDPMFYGPPFFEWEDLERAYKDFLNSPGHISCQWEVVDGTAKQEDSQPYSYKGVATPRSVIGSRLQQLAAEAELLISWPALLPFIANDPVHSIRKAEILLYMWPFDSPELGPVSSAFYESHTLYLGKFDIRVLLLHRGSKHDDIVCTLERRLLPPIPPFEVKDFEERSQQSDLDCTTLSYQWGNPKRELRKIQCNGADFLVTKNLYSAPLHIRSLESDRSLWVDAICIDQGNNHEKANQVQRMGEIYRRSKHTLVWVGDGGFLSRAALRTCSMLAETSRRPGAANAPPPFGQRWNISSYLGPFLILLLLRRSYFSRTWIIQEIALSHHIEVACGNQKISWPDFSYAVAIMLGTGMGCNKAMSIGNTLVARALLPWASRSGRIDGAYFFQTLTARKRPLERDILTMAALFRRNHSTDPVDKLFGLLGLCEQIQAGSTYDISPTYSRDDPDHRNQVYIGAARTILSSRNCLSLFAAINRRPSGSSYLELLVSFYQKFRFAKRGNQALPTWVPDWSDTDSMATLLGPMLYNYCDTLGPKSGTLGGGNFVNFNFESYQQSSHHYSPYIWLCGRQIDAIAELGEICNTEKAQSSIWFSIMYTFTLAENHRLDIFSKWERQFRTHTPDGSFWDTFVTTVTCGLGNTTYDESKVFRLLAHYRARSPWTLPGQYRIIFVILSVLPLAITAWTGRGLVERILIYWCFPLVAVSSMWYSCFQLVPHMMIVSNDHGVEEGFLKADFGHMEMRRMARLGSGFLALVPEAACVGDQVWNCRGGIVPLVLRSSGDDFEMVGECYSTMATAVEKQKSDEIVVRLI